MIDGPQYLNIIVLPDHIKAAYLPAFDQLLEELATVNATADYNASDPNNVSQVIKEQVTQCRTALLTPQPSNADQLLDQLVQHCKKWDQVYKLNAREIYPELAEIWDQHGY